MSSLSWSCALQCVEVTWDHVVGQVFMAAVPWCLLTSIGVFVGCVFPAQVKETRRSVTQYEYGLASSSSSSGTAVLSVCVLQTVVFAMRSAQERVDAVYHALEMLGTLIIILDVLTNWLFVVTYGWRQVLLYALNGRLVIDSFVMTAVFAVAVDGNGRGKTWFSFCFLSAIRMMRIIDFLRGQDAFNSRGSWRRQIIYQLVNIGLFVYTAAAVMLTLEHLGNPVWIKDVFGETHQSIYHLDDIPYYGKPNLAICEGDCDTDSDCIGDLLCFQREAVAEEDCDRSGASGDCPTGYERIPFCQGLGNQNWDYCYDPAPPNWGLTSSFLFVWTTISTLGNSPVLPRTICGRLLSVYITFLGLYMMSNLFGPTVVNLLLDRNLGGGSYHPKRKSVGGHVVVVGTPTGMQLSDFLHEIFHPNHFDGIHAFDKEAPEVVVLLSNAATLAQLRRILAHKDSMLFCKRVYILKGEAFHLPDLQRAALSKARMAIVLPNLVVADVASDDAANIMRAFSLGAAAPHVRVQCLLHRANNDPRVLEKGGSGNLHFGCVDSYKMQLIAKACLTKGALALVCNLCKTIGERDTTNMKPWQRDYEHSIGGELYELPLSVNYHSETFAQVFLDIMARSVLGEVYMIGIIEPDEDEGEVVRIHPSHDYVIHCDDGTTSGIFIAPDVGAICQRGDEGDSGFWDRFVPRQAAFDVQSPRGNNRSSKDPEPDQATNVKAKIEEETELPGGLPLPPGMTKDEREKMSFAELLAAAEEAMKETPAERERKFAAAKYSQAMQEIKSRLLVGGVKVEHVSSIANALVYTKKKHDDLNFGDPPTPPDADQQELVEQVAIVRAPQMSKTSVLYRQEDADAEDLLHKNKLQEVMEKTGSHAAPAPIEKLGGHILLCIVSDTTSSSHHLAASPDGLGPPIGIEHFMRPLRDNRFKGTEFRPAVAVLADVLPCDWHTILEHERVYFVRGSPLELSDLERAGFRHAKTIAIVRAHLGGDRGCSKVADARVLLLASLIEKNLPRTNSGTVITDLSFDGSCSFLPPSRVPVEPPATGQAVAQPRHVSNLRELFMDSANDGDHVAAEEDYESLLTLEYAHHHRFMTGQIFIASSMTALVANTLYNPSLLQMVDSLMQAPMILLPLPQAWEKKTYALLVAWLMKKRNLLALGLIRSAQAAEAGSYGSVLDENIPTHHYVFTAPPAYKTLVVKTDRILCLAPTRVLREDED